MEKKKNTPTAIELLTGFADFCLYLFYFDVSPRAIKVVLQSERVLWQVKSGALGNGRHDECERGHT